MREKRREKRSKLQDNSHIRASTIRLTQQAIRMKIVLFCLGG
jgi:hypothetical protein